MVGQDKKQMDCWMDRKNMNEKIDGWLDEQKQQMDGWMDIKNVWLERKMDGWLDGQEQ